MKYMSKLFERFLEWSFQRNADQQFNQGKKEER